MSRSLDVRMSIDANATFGAYEPIWNWFGYDEPNYTTTGNGRQLLRELMELSPKPVRIRTHNLLTSGDGTPALKWGSTNAYTEGDAGNPVYDWSIMDGLFDTWVGAGAVPFVQIGFTPEAMSDYDGPYRHSWTPETLYESITTGWAAPPNDLDKWTKLIETWMTHLIERYGRETVAGWPFEVWNEPDGHYWLGTVEEFCSFYEATARMVKRVLPEARVGGPHTCGPNSSPAAQAFLRTFLDYCAKREVPIDFIAFHAKGRPVVHDGHVRMGLHEQIGDIEINLGIQSEYPQFRDLPAILGESDPEGCAACSARVHPQNAYRNGPLFGAYVVEAIARTYEVARRANMRIEGSVSWAFLFEDQPMFDGFRDLATNGVGKPVLNAFRMLGMLGGEWLRVESSHAQAIDEILANGVRDTADVNALATRDETGISILIWHYHDDDIDGALAEISLELTNWSGRIVKGKQFRTDADHGNAYSLWREMGSPASVAADDLERLKAASELPEVGIPETQLIQGASVQLAISLPRQGVTLLRLEW